MEFHKKSNNKVLLERFGPEGGADLRCCYPQSPAEAVVTVSYGVPVYSPAYSVPNYTAW